MGTAEPHCLAANVVLRGLEFMYSRGSTLSLLNVSDVLVDNCTMANAGTHGLEIRNSSNTTISNSEIYGAGERAFPVDTPSILALFTPESQWQSRGKIAYLTGVCQRETLGGRL